MVAVLLRFFKDPRNDEIALQHFFFFLTAAQEFFSITFVLHAIFFCRQALAGNFFSKSPTPAPQELNGRPLRSSKFFTSFKGLSNIYCVIDLLRVWVMRIDSHLTFAFPTMLFVIPTKFNMSIVFNPQGGKRNLISRPIPINWISDSVPRLRE